MTKKMCQGCFKAEGHETTFGEILCDNCLAHRRHIQRNRNPAGVG